MVIRNREDGLALKRKLRSYQLVQLPLRVRPKQRKPDLPGAACLRLGTGGAAYIEAMCLMVDAIRD